MRIAKAVSAVSAEDQPGQKVSGTLLDRLDRLFRPLRCPALHQRFTAVEFLIADDAHAVFHQVAASLLIGRNTGNAVVHKGFRRESKGVDGLEEIVENDG